MLLILFLIITCSHVSMNKDPGPEYADVVFLVDSSDHLGTKSFPLVKAFIHRMVSSLPIEAHKYRVAVAQYSDRLHSEFQLGTFKSRNPMLNHLKKNLGFLGGSLRTGHALREAHRTYFSAPAGGRDKKQFPPILVVLASAQSEDDVEEASKALREDGVRIVSVGLQSASEEELKAMATAQFHFNLRSARDLGAFSQNMTQIIKEATQYRDGADGAADDILVEVCQGPSVADVVFLLDVSVNGSQENFEYLKEFLEESVSALDIKEHCMRVGLVTYSNETKVINSLSRGVNKSEVLQNIQNLSPWSGKAYTGAAIRKIRKEVFSARNGSRKNQGVPQIAVLVTHRPSEDNVTKAAVNLRREGVTIFTMGIEGASDSQLEKIASHPAEQHVSKLKTFSDLAAHNQTFLKKLRNQIMHTVSVFSERTETLKSGCVDTEEADIYLLIDGSGSTQATDFHEMKTFLSEVVGMFNIAPQKVRVGAVQYADSWDLEFEINKYTNKHDLGKAIENIRQMGGNTNTGAALNFTLGLLQKAKKQRGNRVPCHLVVLTNGMSKDSILEPANRLREELIRVYAIGVKEANQTQLREIAGEEKRVYYVHDFDALKDIRNQVVQEICAEEACKEMKADIMFLVDSSGSIGLENFIKMKTFMKNLVSKSQIGADRVQIGVVQFSDVNKEEFQLNRYMSQNEISNAIDRMTHIGETTLTGSALTFVSQYFSPAKGARPNVRRFLILITDGEAQDIVKDPAVALRQEGIIIYSVGVFGSNVTQLEEISGRPEMVFYVENFDILQHIEDDLVFGICSPREECKRIEVLDVVFVIDSSGSIDHDEYSIMKDFMVDLVKKADVGKNQVRFGALKYADDPEVLFYLGDLGSKWEVISVLQKDQPMGGNTYTAEALGFSDHMFTEARGSRLQKGVPQVLIVITDGESHDADKLNATAKALRDKGILVLLTSVSGGSIDCFVDVVVGFDISTHENGQTLLEGQSWIETYLQDLLHTISSLNGVSCEVGTETQVSVAFQVTNAMEKYSPKFEIYSENILNSLKDVTVKGPSLLNANLLSSLWDAFQNKSAARGKVVLLFSDGLDDDIEKLEQKSDELRKEGLNALVTVALDGATDSSDLADLLYIEFGKGFEYRTQLTIGMRDLGSRLSKQLVNVAERTCCCLFCKCIGGDGIMGDPGPPGKKGSPGFKGSEGYLGEEGIAGDRGAGGPVGEQGIKGCDGAKGPKGNRGLNGQEGEVGESGVGGLHGEQGESGLPGEKGEKGDEGSQGSPGKRGVSGDRGAKGQRGDPGVPGFDNTIEGPKGLKGERGRQGRRGWPGPPGTPGSRRKTAAHGRRGHTGPQGKTGIPGPDGLEGSWGLKGPQGPRGETGVKGEKGGLGSEGPQGPPGPGGEAGSPGHLGSQGNKGEPGDLGEKGAIGLPGPRGLPGDDGNPGYGSLGSKGAKGQEGFPGESGPKGETGDPGGPGETGPKGARGMTISNGPPGEMGSPGEPGPPGRKGVKGARGLASFSMCELIQYVRDHSPGGHGEPECPVHPTELVFALDQSRDVTKQEFERMKELMSSLVRGVRVRETSCPVGARIAILTYTSHARHLVRFSDAYRKQQLLREIEAIPYERSSDSREIGKVMRFISRNVFKRTLPGAHTRRIATFFSSGQSADAQTIATATMEFSALDIIPVVIAFSNVPSVKRAFAIDDTGTFQVIMVPSGTDYAPALERLQRCTFCYDVCKPDAFCDQAKPPPAQSYMDAAFLLDSSRHVGSAEFEDIRHFLGALLDHFEITPEPGTSVTGDRVALLSHAPPNFLPNTQKSPVRTEFNLTTYNSKRLMRRHLEKSVQQLNGDAFIGHALQWTLDNIFLNTPNMRRNKVIFVISAGETSHLDKETLKKESLRAKCQGYALFVFSLGPAWNDKELEDLASYPLDHHLVQLGRIHKPDHRYSVKIVRAFINSIRRAINKYPPINFKMKCSRLSSTDLKQPARQWRSFVPGPHKTALKEDALQKAKFFQDKKYLSRVARGSRDDTIRNLTRNTFHAFKNGKKVIKTAPNQHDKGSA
ncbi:LOW QUALITY PROTEIN: collagen alpha-6(VI) chain [Ailuropoda melanoleuca]|uniref:LOW QUALITY PROTEIN: collagen alpha-6(VI) chain n=1 Tax=Ailuropoda melanoleuca TaxID=9646 RepID=UPI001494197B|nr:LOW QUALITY PROTEIN: collagen alpha-6(VI) chain [Ailuropoda melanoleuca]